MSEHREEEPITSRLLQVLVAHRKRCEQRGNYVEAEITKNRIEEIKRQLEKQEETALRARQISQRLGLEETHMMVFQQFQMSWERKMSDFKEQAEKMISDMKSRHDAELRDLQKQFLNKHQKIKYSPVLLNYRKIQEHLAKSKNYTEAHKIKVKADRLETLETEKWIKQKQDEMFKLERKFKNLKRQELCALQKRIQTGLDEQKKQRDGDLLRLMKRHRNLETDLTSQQISERTKREKKADLGSIAKV